MIIMDMSMDPMRICTSDSRPCRQRIPGEGGPEEVETGPAKPGRPKPGRPGPRLEAWDRKRPPAGLGGHSASSRRRRSRSPCGPPHAVRATEPGSVLRGGHGVREPHPPAGEAPAALHPGNGCRHSDRRRGWRCAGSAVRHGRSPRRPSHPGRQASRHGTRACGASPGRCASPSQTTCGSGRVRPPRHPAGQRRLVPQR
jgi:hypothetical protein